MIFDASGREYVRAIGFESKLRPKHGGAEAADCVSGYSIEVDSAASRLILGKWYKICNSNQHRGRGNNLRLEFLKSS